MPFREYHYRWMFDLNSNPEQIWPFVADTNRFNRDTGMPTIDIDSGGKRLPNARRRVRFSLYGVPVEWEERPFEWVRPVRFGIERIYSKGPMTELRVLVQLAPKTPVGTTLSFEIWAKPRNAIGAAAIALQIGVASRRKFRATIEKYDRMAIAGTTSHKIGAPAASLDRQRVVALKERLLTEPGTAEAVERLISFVETADDFAASRIQPYQLADEWRLPRRQLLEACLRATRAGLLDLQWDLLCPLCRGAKVSSSSLKEVAGSVHCSTCRIDFNVNFDRFVELTFRPNAAVRNVEVQDYCVGSPERTPHVVVQQLLVPGEVRDLEIALEPGNYRIRALELDGQQGIVVSDNAAISTNIEISRGGWGEQSLTIAPVSSLQLRNKTDQEQLLIFERTAWSDQAATAVEVTALQVFRDLFSTEALRPGEQISVGTLTVLFTDLRHSTQLYREIGDATAFGRVMNHFDVLKELIAQHDGALVKTIGDAVMAVFQRPASALRAMLAAQQQLAGTSMPLSLKAGLHSGPCIAVTLNDRLDYFGSTVNFAARLEGLSSGADIIISQAVLDDPEVKEMLASGSYEANGFDMVLKGFDDKVDLWRISRS